MGIETKKVKKTNFLPTSFEGRYIVLAEQFNALIDYLDNTIDIDGIDARIDAYDTLVNDGAVTQATSITTAVTLDKKSGVVTTVSSTLAAGSSTTFTVNNSYVTASSVVLVTVAYGGAGSPNVLLNAAPGTGSFVVRIDNVHASAALNNTLKIHFVVI